MLIGNGHWESNFFNGYFSPIVVEKCVFNKDLLQVYHVGYVGIDGFNRVPWPNRSPKLAICYPPPPPPPPPPHLLIAPGSK